VTRKEKRMHLSTAVLCCFAGLGLWTASAGAQTSAPAGGRQPGRSGSFEVSAAALWLAPASLGTRAATMTRNGSSAAYTYFQADGHLGGALGVDARATYNLSHLFAIEGGFVFSKPQVTFSISRDAEGASVTADGERITQVFADGNLLVFPRRLRFAGGRGHGFVEAGAGYLRQLHVGNLNLDSGTVYNAGGGMKYYFKMRPRGLVKGLGVRVDVRAYYRRGGFSFDNADGWNLALAGGAIAAF
jgi:hypothetical protein